MFLEYVLFAIIFIYITLWVQIHLFYSSLVKKKAPITRVRNDQLQQFILKKTNTNIKSIKISESDHLFGMMIGIPGKPQLILSRKLYETFSQNELEYIVLHEAGHYKLMHSITELIGAVLLLISGFIISSNIDHPMSLLYSILLGIGFGIIMIRLGRIHEYQADKYVLKLISDPEGMIKATENFKSYYGRKYSENKNKYVQSLFYRSNPYSNRIKMAENDIERRKRFKR
jgi:Zn-dependent protease with chaperone function